MNFSKLKSWIACRNPQHCVAKLLVVALMMIMITPVGREWLIESLGRLHGEPPVVGEWRDWDKPSDPRELGAYNFAHAIKLPDSLPKPVPFNFTRHLLDNRSITAGAYFQHLCDTEAGEYIFKTVDKVDGLYQMRPMPGRTTELMRDRYGFEDPADWSQGEADGSPTLFIGGPGNGFVYFESPREPKEIVNQVEFPRWVVHQWDKPTGPLYWKYHSYDYTNSRIGPTADPEETLTAHYGYTWRGIRRERDREFGVAGGELMVLDLQTNEVLAVRRSFALAKIYSGYKGKGVDWEFAYFCPDVLRVDGRKRLVDKTNYPFSFVFEVLKPINYDASQIRMN